MDTISAYEVSVNAVKVIKDVDPSGGNHTGETGFTRYGYGPAARQE
jgi:hypothetical protein